MGRTKQTPRGSASHQPVGMTAATFTGMGRGKAGPEEQFRDAPEEDTEEDFPLVLEDIEKQPKEGRPGASKSNGKRKRRPQKEQRPLLRKPHRIPHPPNHRLTQPLQNLSQGQARLPPRTPPRPPQTKPPSLPPETPTKMNHQLPPSMLWHTRQQAKIG